jgi:hypothetical protein
MPLFIFTFAERRFKPAIRFDDGFTAWIGLL